MSPAAGNFWEGLARDHITDAADMEVSSYTQRIVRLLATAFHYLHRWNYCNGHSFRFNSAFSYCIQSVLPLQYDHFYIVFRIIIRSLEINANK